MKRTKYMPASAVRYASPDFQQLVQRLAPGQHATFVFAGGDKRTRQEAFTRLDEHLSYNLHRVKADTLIGTRHIKTQGNLREVFDNTEGSGNLLVFENADALYELPGAEEDPQAEKDEGDTMMPIDYTLERAAAFKGIVVICFREAAYARRAGEQDAVDYIVSFEE